MREVGLAYLFEIMKHAGLLNPEDKNKIVDSDEELSEQVLWGAPKLRYFLLLVHKYLYSPYRPETHRTLCAFFHWPRPAEMFLKVCWASSIDRQTLQANATTAFGIPREPCKFARHLDVTSRATGYL